MNVNISGNINNIALVFPSAATVQVAGDTYNFGFIGQNLSPSDVTRIRVGGSIGFRGNLTDTPLSDGYPPEALDTTFSTQPLTVQKLIYSPTTQKLTWVGQMTDAERQYLLAPERFVYDRLGLPVLNPDGSPKTEIIPLTTAQADAIQTLYKNSQDASLGGQGLALSGPGQFNIVASRIDLGVSAGIFVTTSTSALESISPYSASIAVDIPGKSANDGHDAIPGDLVMTSSRISNEGLGGAVRITTAGKVDVGAQESALGSDGSPRGIYTTGGGNITLNSQRTSPAKGDPVAGEALSAMCGGCHGARGVSVDSATPSLAGQDAQYLGKATRAYRTTRQNWGMQRYIANLGDKDIDNIVAFYASQAPKAGDQVPSSIQDLATKCNHCHELDNPAQAAPKMNGQDKDYLVMALRAYRDGKRESTTMHTMSFPYSNAIVEGLASWYASQPAK